MDETVIRNFQEEDMPLLGELYNLVCTKENAVFWWVGDSDNWINVFCAFEDGEMVAKGQVSIINIVPTGRLSDCKHSIYVNLKTIPERESDYELLEKVYPLLVSRALQLKESLSKEYSTILCVGNDSTETANLEYFTQQKNFQHLESLFTMTCDLNEPIPQLSLSENFQALPWEMETSLEESEYLTLEAEVWPDTPLGQERLSEYKQNPLWTTMVVRESNTIVGSLMVWKEANNGIIEDVFVRKSWRGLGIAKYLLTEALNYLKMNKLENAQLVALTTNKSALSLYESVGFKAIKEEVRFFTELR